MSGRPCLRLPGNFGLRPGAPCVMLALRLAITQLDVEARVSRTYAVIEDGASVKSTPAHMTAYDTRYPSRPIEARKSARVALDLGNTLWAHLFSRAIVLATQ